MHCDANAYCLLIPETSDFKCECKPGYNGTGTECTDVCTGYCDNEGVCLKDSRGQPSCRCSGSFTGKRCTEKSEFFYITGGIAGGVILIIFVVLLVWMICVRLVDRYFPYVSVAFSSFSGSDFSKFTRIEKFVVKYDDVSTELPERRSRKRC